MCFGENYSMLLHMIVVLASFVFLEKDVEAAKKYNYAGCYETTDRSRILYQHVKKLDKLTPRTCVDWCHSMQSAYAGLQKNECRCDQYQPPEIIRRSFRDCGHLCPGDRNSRCGGGDHKISIYETGITTSGDDAIPARAYLGCYPDDDTDNRILKGSNYEFSDNTPSKCHKLCYRLGFRFFGLINVKYCICGDTPPSKGNAIPGENCQSICNGDENKYCGGDQKLSLYATGINNIPEFGRYLGCYDNSKLKDIKADITLNLTLTNSQGRCFNICDQKGFKYAGVQKGTLCMCLNKAPSLSFEDYDEECDDTKYACRGELTDEYCGSANTMKVFRTRRTDEVQLIEVDYQGCYIDQKNYPTLDGIKEKFEKTLTPQVCIETCKFKGYAFSGVESGKECYCSHSYPTIYAKAEERECNMPCSGSRNNSCGGLLRIAVYDTGIPHPQALVDKYYIGCYKDDVPGSKLLEGTTENMEGYLSPIVCYKQCLLTGFLFFGLTITSDETEKCLCSDKNPLKSLLTDDKECQRKCTGDSNKVCGDAWRVATYRTGLSDVQSKYTYKGCYENDEYVLIDREIDQSDTLTPRRCYRLQWRFCRCGNDFASDRTPDGEEKCNISCPGNSSETCGGHKKYIQVYQIISNIEETKVGLSKEAIFTENFNTLDTSVWSYTVKIANEPNYEFVTYERSPAVVFLKGGKLFIKPKIQSDEYVQSSITLQNCTGKPIECTRKAQGYQILPPIQSGQLTTKNKFSFRYGKVEIRAKLPIGDWIVPEIWLAPTKYEYGDSYQSGQIRIAMVRGNKDLNCFDNHYGHKRLEMGVYISDESEVRRKVFYKMATESWSKAYHNYTVIWTPEKISFQVDSEEIGTIQPESHETIRQIVGLSEHAELTYANATNKLAPFDKEFHIALGISVGGITDFYDDCIANPKKPWSNTSPKAMLNFWKAKEQWIHTWTGNNSALQIEHVIVRPLSIKTS
ncbi:uncharacterized protein LOC135846612 isoform X2 [Planococcus citri]|uniref:uncharacterized protein LOC135846612 isoform X2 n=1 Tax=Planococcus citri TaxID=170843 RepID=UPI0031FA124A